MTKSDSLVSSPAADELPAEEDPTSPKVGRWYWVSFNNEKSVGCIIHVGSNYAELRGVGKYGWSSRVHFDNFDNECEFIPNPDEVIGGKIAKHQENLNRLLVEVRDLSARLSITAGPELTQGGEAQALALYGNSRPVDKYKTDLVEAKEKTLPDLFKEIESESDQLGAWMKASIIPLRAQAQALKPVIQAVENRIFSLELYAGLVETVTQISDGEPAPLNEKVRLFQRRAYMDEECLVRYESGGMEFRDIDAFDKWIARPENMHRILPFPRCIVAFRVRRNVKEREMVNLRDFIRIMDGQQTDKFTYLYIRNGDRLSRLSTEIEFGEKLFPDMERSRFSGKIWAEIFADRVEGIIPDAEYQAIVDEETEKKRQLKKIPKKDRWMHDDHHRRSQRYQPFDSSSVHYDDIAQYIQSEMTKHNRLVLVLQGLLDRSPVLHPHPQWSLWSVPGFAQALELIYDDARSLTSGDKPDFEAYRARLNASLRVGSITVGQEDAWQVHEAVKESERRDKDYRWKGEYRPTRFVPEGNPGPGLLARVKQFSPKAKRCTYEWHRVRAKDSWRSDPVANIRCTFTAPASRVLHVDAYKPGDYRQFFDDPRTRAEYLKWAPLLLFAEEYHAGHRKVVDRPAPKKEPKTEPDPHARWQRQQRKQAKLLIGRAVRLVRDMAMRNGRVYAAGTLWRVTHSHGAKLHVHGIRPDGKDELNQEELRDRHIRGLDLSDVEIDLSVPANSP